MTIQAIPISVPCRSAQKPVRSRALYRLYIGSISASPTACPLRGYGRAGTQNDRLSEAVISSTSTPIPTQWTRRRRCRDAYICALQISTEAGSLKAVQARTCGKCLTVRIDSSTSALSRHRRRHVHCAGMGVPVLKMTASPSTGTPIHPCYGHAVGDAEIEPCGKSLTVRARACISTNCTAPQVCSTSSQSRI